MTIDAAYLLLPRYYSIAASHYRLGWINNPTQVNGPLVIICQTLKNVVGSTTKLEAVEIYIGGKHACPILTMLK